MKRCARRSRMQNGFSLVELLIAMAISLVMLGTVLSIYQGTTAAGKQSDTVTRMGEDATIALETLARHIRMAGYSQPVFKAPRNEATFQGQTVEQTDSNLAGAGLRGCDLGFNSTSAAWDSLTCATTSTNADAIAVRYEGDTFNTDPITAGTDKNASDCLSQGVEKTTASAVTGGPQYALVESRFFIADKYLKCAGNGNASFTAQPLVSGVEFMRLRYGIAKDANAGQVIGFATAAEVSALGGSVDQNWGRVVAVRICIQMVSTNEDQGKAVPFHNCDGVLTTPTDKYLHRTFSTTVSLRSRAGIAQ